ncbi:hypothetical protein PV10_06098 [Exophiala mesophila]|uniref:VASt domain-containing protein n=1 Tax=Exophiala mesophila TaxID=212818 RepID=A0A0D1WR51_EXOME|nr:uncharacterized protein PV10_06098 [Exophiala mesophila]KIV91575.1 hypothetical protein PV10_06098 [Exophiala mesophila]
MASSSARASPNVPPVMPEQSPQLSGLKKVLSSRRRSSDLPSNSSLKDSRQKSLDSLTLERSPTRRSIGSDGRDDASSKSGSSGVRKLLPGHTKRRRRKLHEKELKAVVQDLDRQTHTSPNTLLEPVPPALSRRTSSLGPDGDSSLLTDDSELETPSLISRDSHTGYLTMSSPLMTTNTTLSDSYSADQAPLPTSVSKNPISREPNQDKRSPSPKSPAIPEPSPSFSPMDRAATTGGLIDRADTLHPESRKNSVSKIRGISPGRRLRDVLGKSGKSPRVSPERRSTDLVHTYTSPLSQPSLVPEPETYPEKLPETIVPIPHPPEKDDIPMQPPLPPPVQIDRPPNSSMPNLNTSIRPMTPPAALINTPFTTVTPPTPTDARHDDNSTGSPRPDSIVPKIGTEGSGIIVSPSGNMISHRKTRSTSSISHQPSKLSNYITAPLTPTNEEPKTTPLTAFGNRTPSGGLFSSWMSAAQNAATTFTNLTTQNRSRAGTASSDPSIKPKPVDEPIKEEEEDEAESSEPAIRRKQLAVETLGSGDLNFEHLGLSTEEKSYLTHDADNPELRKDSTIERDVAAAKIEDMMAKRAVSAAYEQRHSNGGTPVAEISDPLTMVKPSQTFGGHIGGERTPPNGSILDGDTTSIKRTNSVRSKLAKRRSRGSSTATGQSAIGAMIGASNAALANPAKAPRLPGVTPAPKQRNRNFHQQFRSVPEDDNLIEDYSCALQKEILLAGRLYISEGHICFFSNILGWVTTVVISFDEVVSIERENTAVVFQNAIAVQTLHARHTFRSLIYREQTYDLLIGIWRVSHPASFQKSMNGKQIAADDVDNASTIIQENGASAHVSEDSGSDQSDSDDDNDSAPSIIESSASNPASELADPKTVSRKTSAMNASAVAQASSILAGTANDLPPALAGQAGVPDAAGPDFPGPATHGPTECTDSATHYDKIIKDEILPAPVGKIYSLLYGPESGIFVRKFLSDDCKCTELVLEDDKKGLNGEIKSRQYTYIKPLGGSIGPRQTKCITTENLDFFDLEKAVTVTCTTQTPDVPSGNAFSTKTRYCLTWAPGNATRLQMNCTIEWTAKSWLKGPIEKGANDGQQQYGDALVKVLKAAVSGRPRGTTNASKVSRSGGKKKRRSEKRTREEKIDETTKANVSWGILEPLRRPLQPVTDILGPVVKMEVIVVFLSFMVLLLWFRGSGSGSAHLGAYPGYSGSQIASSERLAAYENLWVREENEFWDWLEARANVDTILFREQIQKNRRHKAEDASESAKQRQKQRKRTLYGRNGVKEVETKIKEEKISQRAMEDAIKITRDRLEILEHVVEKNRKSRAAKSSSSSSSSGSTG